MATFPVVLDSCVIFQAALRDTLFRAAEKGLYRLHFSEKILRDTTRNLIESKRITAEKAKSLEDAILEAFPDAVATPSAALIDAMTNDPGDRHVVATGVVAHAQVIVTFNLKHFPASALSPYSIEAQSPDQFLTHLYDLYPDEMMEVIQEQAEEASRPSMTTDDVLNYLQKSVPQFSGRGRRGLQLANRP
jgi:predicted nucleic acid-binding protein